VTTLETITIRTSDGKSVTTDPATMRKALDAVQRGGRKPKEPNLGSQVADGLAPGGSIAADRLRSIIERIERLEEERKALGDDIKDIYAEAKSAGFDVKVLRQLIRIRKQEPADVEEFETLLDLYRRALGM
jgi:uncharacterized protein (UPF0335 family)